MPKPLLCLLLVGHLGLALPLGNGKEDRSWIYFASREDPQATGPQLVLELEGESVTLDASADAGLIAYLPQRIGGHGPKLSLSLNDSNRALIAFEAHALSGLNVTRAALRLDMRLPELAPAGPFTIDVHAVESAWEEDGACWETQPDFAAQPLLSQELQPEAAPLELDVSRIVQDWAAGKRPNHGLLLKAAGVTSPPSNTNTPPTEISAQVPGLTFPYELEASAPLPWPHQAPGLEPEEVSALERAVWVVNDFPLYQADASGTERYFHGGLDIVLANGTPIYAVEAGWVKARMGDTVVIGSARGGRPAFGWAYSHLADFAVEVGDYVPQGTRIGAVQFRGLEHTHVAKVFSEGEHWAKTKYIVPPYAHFAYQDEQPPTLDTPFHFFANDGPGAPDGNPLESLDPGPLVLSGAIDIVVGMRDGGLYAHAKDSGEFGDRLGVARIEYSVAGPSGTRNFKSFDFNRIRFRKSYDVPAFNTQQTRVVFKHWTLFEHSRPHGSRTLSYYVITNHPKQHWMRELTPAARRHGWDTAATHEGERLFPNGPYEVTVTAWDFKGNHSSATMPVFVKN